MSCASVAQLEWNTKKRMLSSILNVIHSRSCLLAINRIKHLKVIQYSLSFKKLIKEFHRYLQEGEYTDGHVDVGGSAGAKHCSQPPPEVKQLVVIRNTP